MYRRLLDRGWAAILVAFLAAAAAMGWFLPRVTVDASTSMLLDEKDPDLAYYDDTRKLWTNDDEFAIVCCRRADWFTPRSIEVMKGIEAALAKVPHVSKIESPLSIPLMRCGSRSLAQEGVDLAKARAELVSHTIAAGTFVSADGRDATFLPYLAAPPELQALDDARAAAEASGDSARIAEAVERHEAARAELRKRRSEFVDAIRRVAAEWRPELDEPAALSGLPFINLSLIEHVTHDLEVFGIASLALFTLAFLAIYRRLRWTALPILTCLLPVVLVLGAMAALGLKLTVITANLPVLLFVVMLPYTVYFVERYRERRAVFAGESHADTNAGAARDIWLPCLYSCTTTMAGFASLMTSGVKPVWWFGCMMTIGLAAGLACAFLFLPAASRPLGAIEAADVSADAKPSGLVRGAERAVLRAPRAVVAVFACVLGVSVWGATKLDVENKFVDYFWPSSEVHRGLTSIDARMGGTTPADIILSSGTPGFFHTPAGLDAIRAAVKCVEPVPEAGTVWSFASLVDEVRKFLPPAPPKAVAGIPAAKSLVRNFVSEDASKTRVLVRFQETAQTLKRRTILAELDARLAAAPELKDLSPRVTGVFKLYANMLDSLLQSQKDTFAMVLAAVWTMVALAFTAGVRGAASQRPLAWRAGHAAVLAAIVLLPQALPAVVCLGVMGFAGIPLDLITVTVAAIAMGVGIDAAIQYTVRWRTELEAAGGDRAAAVTRTHATVGRSIWLATSIMVAGFVVLALSDFVPTVSFGLFNALAMVAGQVAALTVVPALFLVTGFPRR
ncbi:MAG: hypothetical protein HMLKMBBP_01606 [Planctomycetes bacterium]|nr:hypothetical protein [Planctomycetota bacterium]